MANFSDSNTFSTHDDYYTPKSAWEDILPLVNSKFPAGSKVFECFLLGSNEQSKKYLTELNFNVIGDKTVDFLDNSTWSEDMLNKHYDLILSNPPFQKVNAFSKRHDNLKYKCLKKLLSLDKPFVILMNSLNIYSKWFAELVEGKDIKFIYPSHKIEYDKYKQGGVEKIEQLNKKGKKSSVSFYSIYVCYNVIDKNEWI